MNALDEILYWVNDASDPLLSVPVLAANQSWHHHNEDPRAGSLATPLLRVADFDASGKVNWLDIKDLASRLFSREGEDDYHPLYDLNADQKLNLSDLFQAFKTVGSEVPLLDQQIARATQATMRYYGPDGVKNAVADGYLPFTQELKGHGFHYLNPNLALEIGTQKQLDIERPVGLNYDAEGNLQAVFYLRLPQRQQPTPENPLAGLLIDPTDDAPPETSFDTLSREDWHHHHGAWITGIGELNPELVYFEEEVPFETTVQRLQQTEFQLFPQSEQYYAPKFWMLHGWFHSLNPSGTFAETNPHLSPYVIEELGDPHHQLQTALIAGTDANEDLLGTAESDRLNGFSGDDIIVGNLSDDHIWGGFGNDTLRGDRRASSSSRGGGDDLLYGGPGNDLLYGQAGDDRLFGGTLNDQLWGGKGDDLLRGGLGKDKLRGDPSSGNHSGKDAFFLVPDEGTDIVLDFEVGVDKLVLGGGLAPKVLSISQQESNTLINLSNQTLAILNDVNATQLTAANVFSIA